MVHSPAALEAANEGVLIPGTTYYVAAFSDATTELTAGTAPGYTREAFTMGQATAGSQLSNLAATFGPNSSGGAAWPQITHAAIFTALTGGTAYIGPEPVTTPRTVADGQTASFPIGDITQTAT